MLARWPTGTAFFVWRLEWPGGDSIRIRYFDTDLTFLDEQVAAVSRPDANAGVKALSGRSVFVDGDWLQPQPGFGAANRALTLVV